MVIVLFIFDYLNDYLKEYFEKVQWYLIDLDIDYVVDLMLVCGLDYYNYIVFELMSEVEGFGVIIIFCGGGCYNGLI